MKKLLAVLVVFALIASAAFAQDFGAGGAAKVELLKGDSGGGDIGTSFASWYWLSLSKTNDDGNMGAKGSISIGDQGNKMNGNGDSYYYAWWKPIDQLFIKLGKVGEDGKYWAGAGVMGWDFQSNDLLISPDFNYYNGFAGSMLPDSHAFFDSGCGDASGLQLSILPIDGLAFNFGWNIGNDFVDTFWGTLAFQVVYDISGLGQAAIGFKHEGGDAYNFAAQWKMPIGSAMKIEAGLKLSLDNGNVKPFDIGLGFGYGSPWGDTFWITARIGASIGFNAGESTVIGLDICPSYDIGLFRVYFPVGFAIDINGSDVLFAYSVNPYIRKQMGGMEFWAGVKLYNGAINADGTWSKWYPAVANTASQNQVNWSVPIAFLWAW